MLSDTPLKLPGSVLAASVLQCDHDQAQALRYILRLPEMKKIQNTQNPHDQHTINTFKAATNALTWFNLDSSLVYLCAYLEVGSLFKISI